MSAKDSGSNWKQYLLAPLVVGVIVLIGQSLLQPIVAEKVKARTERWAAKRDAFLDALLVVDKQLAAYPPNIGPDAPKDPIQKATPPEPDEINRAYAKLVLYADDRGIIDAFPGCFGARAGQSVVWHEERVRLFRLMRSELGFKSINLTPEDIRFWVKKLQQTDKKK